MFKPSRIRAHSSTPAPGAFAGFFNRSQRLRRLLTTQARTRIIAALQPSARPKIIPLFGSRFLVRADDGRSWMLVCASQNPEQLTERESMFINAAITAARGQ